MAFPYKNPISAIQLSGPDSVLLTDTFGTNFSVSSVGGYMEVWNISDLNFQTFGGTGTIQNSGNTIPVTFFKRTSAAVSDRITLNSDAISSGRRRIGMLVYVHETDTTYQYQIDNYETLWNNAVAVSGVITTASTTYTVFNRVSGTERPAGQALIAAWTGSTIESLSGATAANANWKIYRGGGVQITGGTYNSGTTTLNLYNNTGGTISITGFTSGGGGGGTTVTGGTFNKNTGTLTINSSDASSVNISGFTDVYTTGGTLSGATLVLYDSTGGTVNISGFTILDHISYGEASNLDTGLRVIDTEPTSGVTGIFYNYILTNCDNYRAGTFTIITDRTNVDWTEVCTLDLGYTDDVILSADINSGLIRFLGTFPSNDWQLNYVKNTIGSTCVNPAPSATPTQTPTSTITPTPSTSSTTPTPTPSVTSTPTVTPTNTVTPTITPTNTVTPSTTPYAYGCSYTLGYAGGGFVAPPSYTITWNDYYGNPMSHTFTGDNQVPGYTFCAQCGSFYNGGNVDIVINSTNPCGSLPTPTPTTTTTPTNTPTPTVTPTNTTTVTPTNTPTPTPTQSSVMFLTDVTDFASDTLACQNGLANVNKYLAPGTTEPVFPNFVYNDSSLTSAYDGNNSWHLMSYSGSTWAVNIGIAGSIQQVTNCSSIPTPTPTPTVTPTETPTNTPTPTTAPSGGWFFYSPDNQPVPVGPTNNGDTTFTFGTAPPIGTYNPNYTGGTFNLYFNNNNSVGTSYLSQFSGLNTTGGTITISQGSSTAIYSGTSENYNAGPNWINLNVTGSTQMIQSASTSFVSGTSINVVVS